MREYTDQEICQIIQDYDRIIQELRYVVEAFVRELASLDSNDDWLCRLLALQHSGTGSATTHSSLHDLSDLLKNKKFKGMEYSSELQKGINEKLEEIDGIQKIHRCYMCLPRKEHEILQLLYEKFISWNEVAKELQISSRTIQRRRKRALNMIHSIDSQEIRSQVNTEELNSVLNSKIKLYREYFLLYDDPFGIDVIRVHFPLGNFYSVDVKVNLSRGTECGFFRSGFSYYKVEGQSEQATTLIAVVGDREVYKFGCYSFSWILTHFRLIKSIKVYKETESILNQDENDGDNESKKKE